jgi:hypothetical protein
MSETQIAKAKNKLSFTKLDRAADNQPIMYGSQPPQPTIPDPRPAAQAITTARTPFTPEMLEGMAECGAQQNIYPARPLYTSESPRRQPGITMEASEVPTVLASAYYSAGFLKNFIGYRMRVEFLLGTSGAISDRTGTLKEVGASYIVLQPANTDDLLMCDLYSIKFVTIFA